jgi:hypothetical protein
MPNYNSEIQNMQGKNSIGKTEYSARQNFWGVVEKKGPARCQTPGP